VKGKLREPKSIFKAIMAENFPNLGSEHSHPNMIPNKRNLKKFISRHIITKFQLSKTKRKVTCAREPA
jgi:hypothetical protein